MEQSFKTLKVFNFFKDKFKVIIQIDNKLFRFEKFNYFYKSQKYIKEYFILITLFKLGFRFILKTVSNEN